MASYYLDLFLQKQTRYNPNLVQKVVDVHPKVGRPYQAVRWVRRDNAEDEKKISDTQEETVENPGQAARSIFGFRPESNEDFIQQSEVIRIWFEEDSTKSNRQEIEEKIEWLAQNSNDENQNQMVNSPIKQILNSMGNGVNNAQLVELENGMKGVFKSKVREAKSFNSNLGGPQHMREIAAYKLSKLIAEFDGLVPVTALHISKRESDMGSLQEFIPNANTYGAHLDKVFDRNVWDEEISSKSASDTLFETFSEKEIKLASLFDSLIESQDRHNYNFMVDENGKLQLIDNGITFSTVKPAMSLFSAFLQHPNVLNQPFSNEDKKVIENIIGRREEIEKELSPYLAERAIERFFERANEMLEGGVYGYGDYHYKSQQQQESEQPKLIEDETEETNLENLSPADIRWRERQAQKGKEV